MVSIIQRLLLPPAVYNAEKALTPQMRNALARAIPLVSRPPGMFSTNRLHCFYRNVHGYC